MSHSHSIFSLSPSRVLYTNNMADKLVDKTEVITSIFLLKEMISTHRHFWSTAFALEIPVLSKADEILLQMTTNYRDGIVEYFTLKSFVDNFVPIQLGQRIASYKISDINDAVVVMNLRQGFLTALDVMIIRYKHLLEFIHFSSISRMVSSLSRNSNNNNTEQVSNTSTLPRHVEHSANGLSYVTKTPGTKPSHHTLPPPPSPTPLLLHNNNIILARPPHSRPPPAPAPAPAPSLTGLDKSTEAPISTCHNNIPSSLPNTKNSSKTGNFTLADRSSKSNNDNDIHVDQMKTKKRKRKEGDNNEEKTSRNQTEIVIEASNSNNSSRDDPTPYEEREEEEKVEEEEKSQQQMSSLKKQPLIYVAEVITEPHKKKRQRHV